MRGDNQAGDVLQPRWPPLARPRPGQPPPGRPPSGQPPPGGPAACQDAALTGAAAEVLGCVLLAAVIITSVSRPRWLPEPAVAAAAAAVLILAGALPAAKAASVTTRLLPVLGFLAAILVLALLCERAGLFTAAGARLAAAAARPGARGGPARRLLAGVFGLASVTTAVLSLDTTVVLLTPVVDETAGQLGVRARPHLYACAHLANSASLLLPVSNLTNLLAFSVSGLTLTRFTSLMALPWLVAIAVEYAGFRWFFAADLPASRASAAAFPDRDPGQQPGVPLFALVTLAATLAGFAAASAAGISPAWAALAGGCVLAARELGRPGLTAASLVRAASPAFLLFVLALGLVVEAVTTRGLGTAVGELIPAGSALPALLAIAGLAACLASVVNNLPAVLILASVLTAGQARPAAGPLLAVLIGVNIGPNLSYPGSLANLLWRRMLAARGYRAGAAEFTRLGLLTAPAGVTLATVALWAVLHA